jgi:hypothetical protein
MDGMQVEELGPWLVDNWESVRAQLLDGSYQPTGPVGRTT